MLKYESTYPKRQPLGTIILGASIVLMLTGCAGGFKNQTLPPAKATSSMQDKLDVINPELEKLGYNLDSGSLVYYRSSPTEIIADRDNVKMPELIVEEPTADFILQADIGWTATSDQAGCGIVFRADEDLPTGSFYEYDMFRLAGAPAWDIYYVHDGKIQYDLLPYSQLTEGRPDVVNTITLVVVGDTIETIFNSSKGVDAIDKKLTEGQIALLAFQESGKTTCTFSNVWVWELNP